MTHTIDTLMALAERMAVAMAGKPDACELIDARSALHAALVEAITAIKQAQEPVLYQRRMKPDFGTNWTHWDDCSEATFKECLKVPKLHDWTHEARALYTHPAPQRQPLTVQEVDAILSQHDYDLHGDCIKYIVRMTERAHHIGEAP